MGLERLLVASPGESRYRFGLHGAALLASSREGSIEMARRLRAIYDCGISVAHGAVEAGHEDATDAHSSLTRAIHRIVELYRNGIFKQDKKVAEQVEERVLLNAWFDR